LAFVVVISKIVPVDGHLEQNGIDKGNCRISHLNDCLVEADWLIYLQTIRCTILRSVVHLMAPLAQPHPAVAVTFWHLTMVPSTKLW